MPAVYPANIKVFTPYQNRVDIVDADHIDTLQDEMYAVQSVLGTNPHLSTVLSPQATVAARLAVSDEIVNTLAGYFGAGGTITQSQVVGLGAVLSSLSSGLSDAATIVALNAAISGVTSSLGTETSQRTSADNSLQGQINSLTTTTGSSVSSLQTQINNEITNRTNADNTEIAARQALAIRVTDLENRFKTAETQYSNNSARNYGSSGSYQSLYLPNLSYLTNDYGSSINGHPLVNFSGAATRFFTDFPPSPSLWVMTATITFQGTGGSANAGIRGLRLQTAGGSTLAEFMKNANQDPNDEALSVTWAGRLATSPSYYITPQLFQNSGGTLTLRGHTSSTPTSMYFSRIPG